MRRSLSDRLGELVFTTMAVAVCLLITVVCASAMWQTLKWGFK